MDVWFIGLVALLAFGIMTFIRRWNDYNFLFTMAIGFAINANLFTPLNAAVDFSVFRFSVSIVLYVAFVFCVLICIKEYGPKKGKALVSSTIAAIVFSGLIEFLAKISAYGYSHDILKNFLTYLYSSVGTLVATIVIIILMVKLKRKMNVYLLFTINVLLAVIIHGAIYFSLVLLTYRGMDRFINVVFGSMLATAICIILGLISYFINTHWWIPKRLHFRYKKKRS